MALIICPECGKRISSYAHMCIGCGCSMTFIKEQLSVDLKHNPNFFYKGPQNIKNENDAKTHDNSTQKKAVNNYSNSIILPKDFSNPYDNENNIIEWFEEKDYLEEYLDNMYLSMEEGWFYPDIDKYEEENQYYDEWTGKTHNLPFGFHLSNNDDEN